MSNSQILENIVNKFVEYLVKNDINSETVINLSQKLKLVGEVQKIIKQTKKIKENFMKLDASEKIGEIRKLTRNVLRDSRVSNHLSTSQIETIEEVLEESETLEIIVDMVEFVVEETKDPILERLDDNNDGMVTADEIANDVTCCGNKKLARWWSRFFVNCLCCGKNNVVTYEKSNDEQSVVVKVSELKEDSSLEEKLDEQSETETEEIRVVETTDVEETTTAVEETTTAVEETTTEPVVEETTTAPVVEETTTEPVVEETTTEPVVEETTTEPVVEETTDVEETTTV